MKSATIALSLCAVVAVALRQQPSRPMKLSQECRKQLEKLQDPDVQERAEKKCDYPDKTISALERADEAGAVAHTEEMLMKCGKVSEKCAGEIAPAMVMEMRFSGAAVSDKCIAEAEETQEDEKRLAKTKKCEAEEKLSLKVMAALENENVNLALSVAEGSLKKCTKLSDTCSFQVAPFSVISVTMEAMMREMAKEMERQMEKQMEEQRQEPAAPEITVLGANVASAMMMPLIQQLVPELKTKRVSLSMIMPLMKGLAPEVKSKSVSLLSIMPPDAPVACPECPKIWSSISSAMPQQGVRLMMQLGQQFLEQDLQLNSD